MKHVNVVAGVFEHFKKWGADELAATDESNFLIV